MLQPDLGYVEVAHDGVSSDLEEPGDLSIGHAAEKSNYSTRA